MHVAAPSTQQRASPDAPACFVLPLQVALSVLKILYATEESDELLSEAESIALGITPVNAVVLEPQQAHPDDTLLESSKENLAVDTNTNTAVKVG